MLNHTPNKPKKFDQGLFIPTNKHKVMKLNKYGGIFYRSSMEKKVMIYLDLHVGVIRWSAEGLEIPYILTEKDESGIVINASQHRYFPDIYYELKMDDGSTRRIVMEIKPAKQCQPPEPLKRYNPNQQQLKNYKWEIDEWNRNMCKWEYAIKHCEKQGIEFKIFTDEQVKKMFALR